MTAKTTEPDLIIEVENLLANAPHSQMRLTLQSNGDITAPDGVVVFKVWNGFDNGVLAVAAPDLLRRLVEEVKAKRSEVETLELTVQGLLDRIGSHDKDNED